MTKTTDIKWYRNQVVISRVLQLIVLLSVLTSLFYLGTNAAKNMADRGVVVGLGFMDETASFKVGFSPFWNFQLGETQYWEIFIIGIQNTILVSAAGVIGATILGFAVGVARLSDNWFLSRFAAIYVEVFRNIPLLLQVFFWYFVLILPALPRRRDSIQFGDFVFISKEGIYIPSFLASTWLPIIAVAIALALSALAIGMTKRWARARFEETGRGFPIVSASLGIAILALVTSFVLSSGSIAIDKPELGRLSISGGFWIPISLFALWVSLVTYTAAFIAENVRGGIQAVSRGQIEASQALGFHAPLSMKLILIPQAMRIIIPPSISQYLNLIKNSSLAVVIGYDDLVNVWMGVSLNQTGQAITIIAMTMGVYTTLSLLTSLVLNTYNTRSQIEEG